MTNKRMTAASVIGVGLVGAALFYALGPYPPFWVQSNIRASMQKWTPDPDSLQLSGLRYSEVDRGMVCGKMNAKNRMGAYVGYKSFAYSSERAFTFLEGIDPSADTMIRMFKCA